MAKEIAQLPIAPDSANPATFNERADAFVKALQPFADDANALAKELEEFSKNVDTKSGDVDTKYADLVEKYNDFITKYGDFFAKYDIFVPAYLDVKKKHGEVAANKEHIDEVKKQIDAALKKATDMINENGIIDDTKTSSVSTFSSTEIVRRLDLKADDATAYREWNYKEISDDYAAQNNDALFVNASKPITITLPGEGKIKIIDKAGSFSKFNVKLVGGADTFVLNKDFQRVELFKFEGKWRVVSGTILREVSGYRVSAKSVDIFSGSEADNFSIKENFLIACTTIQGTVISLDTATNILPATPSISGYSLCNSFVLNGILNLCLFKNNPFQIKIFWFDINSRQFREKDTVSINQKIAVVSAGYNNTSLVSRYILSENIYLCLAKSNSSQTQYKIIKISPDGEVEDVFDRNHSNGDYFRTYAIFKDMLFSHYQNSGTYYYETAKDLITKKSIDISQLGIGGDIFPSIDWTKNKAYLCNSQRTKALEIDLQTRDTKTVSIDASYSQTKPVPRIDCGKQDAYITKDGLFFTDYQNFRKVTSKINVAFKGSDRSSPITKGNKSYIIGLGNTMPKNLIEVTFTPKTFQEEV